MKTTYDRALTVEELAALPDSAIDTRDLPALDKNFWKNAQLVMPKIKPVKNVQIDRLLVPS